LKYFYNTPIAIIPTIYALSLIGTISYFMAILIYAWSW